MTTIPMRTVPGLPGAVPAIGAGCWTIGGPATNNGVPIGWDNVDPEDAYAALLKAYELGVRLFDTADVYGMGRSERLLGRLVKEVGRADLVISSKVGYFAGTAAHPYLPHQLERQFSVTMENLGTTFPDVYFFHSNDFGPDDEHLEDAVTFMHALKEDKAIGAIGMRAPHDFAVEWASPGGSRWSRQAHRFLHLFNTIKPDILTVRHNLLSHQYRPGETDIFTFARECGVGVLIKQALGQGTLLRTHHPHKPRTFSEADHRSADPMFRPEILEVIDTCMTTVVERFGYTIPDLSRVALRYALQHDPDAALLVGFRDDRQIISNVTCLGDPLTDEEITFVREAFAPARDKLHDLTR